MAAKIFCRSLELSRTDLWICFMFGLLEGPYFAHVLISFWCDFDNKNYKIVKVSEF